MTDKFTVRDLLVYFMTGLFLFLILLNQIGPEKLLEFFNIDINKTIIESNSFLAFLAGILLISALYILGHLVCAFTLVITKIIGEPCIDKISKLEKSLPKSKVLKILIGIDLVINRNRVAGVLKKEGNGKTRDQFWKRVHELRHNDTAVSADYWNFMSDLFHGLTLTCLFWAFLCGFNRECKTMIAAIFLMLLFWMRAKYMTKNFVTTIINTWDCKIE